MPFPELPPDAFDDQSPMTMGEIIRDVETRFGPAPGLRVPARAPQQQASDEAAAGTLTELHRLADLKRAGELSLEEFGRQALALLPPQ